MVVVGGDRGRGEGNRGVCSRRHPPGEGDVSPRHLLQVVDGRRLASEAVVGVVVGHDGGGPQLAQLTVGTLQLQLNGLQLRVLAPVHWQGQGAEQGGG